MARINHWKGRTAIQLRHAAIHEAAHAVTGRMLSMVCGTASIVHGETTMTCGFSVTKQPLVIEDAWFTRGKHRGVRATLSILHGQIMTSMAGREAEIIAFGEQDVGADRDDMLEIDRLANYAGDTVTIFSPAYLERLRIKVRPLLRQHWHKVVAVAEALLIKKTLAETEIDTVIRKVTTPREQAIARRIAAARKPMRTTLPTDE
jgi:hypothetical protein